MRWDGPGTPTAFRPDGIAFRPTGPSTPRLPARAPCPANRERFACYTAMYASAQTRARRLIAWPPRLTGYSGARSRSPSSRTRPSPLKSDLEPLFATESTIASRFHSNPFASERVIDSVASQFGQRSSAQSFESGSRRRRLARLAVACRVDAFGIVRFPVSSSARRPDPAWDRAARLHRIGSEVRSNRPDLRRRVVAGLRLLSRIRSAPRKCGRPGSCERAPFSF